MNTLKDRKFDPDSLPGEFNVVEMWSVIRPERLKAGAMAGIFAGVMMLIFGMIYYASIGGDIMAPMKISALPFLGVEAMTYGSGSGLMVGSLVFFALSVVLGMGYAHFTGINNKKGLYGVGLVWGAFSWVFITNLFLQSNNAFYAAALPRGVMFFAWMVFGLSLSSVAWFDKVGFIHKNKNYR